MKKIIVFLTAVFMFAGLFGQEKEVDEYKKLIDVLDGYNLKYEILFEGDVEFDNYLKEEVINDGKSYILKKEIKKTTVDGFIERIENIIGTKDITGVLSYNCDEHSIYDYYCGAQVLWGDADGIRHSLKKNSSYYNQVYTQSTQIVGDFPFM